MQNVEYKAELRDLALAKTICGSLGAKWVATLKQTDTYFRVPDGRLKRRETAGSPTEWVFYSRVNKSKPKLSNFTIYSDEQARERFGTAAADGGMPVLVTVKKTREVWMSRDGVRIHLDAVDDLGKFAEFEALLCPERTIIAAHEQVEKLRQDFRPALGEAIACSYCDLMTGENESKANQ